MQSAVEKSTQKVRQLIRLAEDLVPKMVDVKEKEIGDLLENEMHSTSSAIEQAAKKIEVVSLKQICYNVNSANSFYS